MWNFWARRIWIASWGMAMLMAGCSGGGGSSPAPQAHASAAPTATPLASANAGIVSVYISFPGQAGAQSAARSSSGPKPQWTSPAANQNATLFIDSIPVSGITHVTTAGSYSTSVGAGTHVFTITYYDSSNYVLSSGSASATITSGMMTSVPITMQGQVATITVTTNTLTLGTAVASQSVTVTGKDQDGNTISGTYLYPITLSLSQPNFMNGVLSLTSGGGPNSSVSVTQSGQTITLAYNGSSASGVSGSSLSASTATGAAGTQSLFSGSSVTLSPTIAAGFGRNILNWSPASGSTYNVYRDALFPGQEQLLVSGLSTTSYYDYTVLASNIYYYRVSAVNGSEKFDPTEVSARPNGDPTQLATMALWLDANDASTVTASGGKISQWTDKSGAGNNATQATGSAQPTYVTNVQNGRASVLVGTNIWLGFPTITLTNQLSLFGVGKDTASGTFVFLTNSGGSKFPYFGPYFGGNDLLALDDLNVGVYTSQSNTNAFFLIDTVRSGTGSGQWAMYFNGSAPGSGASPNSMTLNSVNYRGGFSQYGVGYMSEIMAYSAALSTTQRQTLEGYLACKWGLQSLLPTSHPYYSATNNQASCP